MEGPFSLLQSHLSWALLANNQYPGSFFYQFLTLLYQGNYLHPSACVMQPYKCECMECEQDVWHQRMKKDPGKAEQVLEPGRVREC